MFFCINLLIFCSKFTFAQNLKVRSCEFPDSVSVGETVMLKGYIINKANANFANQLSLNIDIEDKTPAHILLDGEIDQIVDLQQVNIAPNDSLYFEQQIKVTASTFRAATIDLIIIWPQSIDNNQNNVASKADLRLTYVKDENTITNSTDEFDFLPNDVLDFVYENYPTSAIKKINIDDCNFEIELNTGEEIEFPIYDCNDNDETNGNDIENNNDYSDDDDDGRQNDDDDDHYNDDDEDYNDDDDDGEPNDEDDDGQGDDDDDGQGDDDDDGQGDDDDDGTQNDEDDEDYNDDDEDYNDDDDDDDDGTKEIDALEEGKKDVVVENFRPQSKNNIVNVDKLKGTTNEYFSIAQLGDQLVIIAKANYGLNTVTLFTLDGKMLLHQKTGATENYHLPFDKIYNKNELLMIQVSGKNLENNSEIQQSRKIFISTY